MEKRRFMRVHFKAKATVVSKETTVEGEIENLSLRGMYLQACTQFKINEEVEVRISLPDVTPERALKTKAVAVRYREGGTGFEFAQMDFDSFFTLQDIIARTSGAPGQVMMEVMKFVNQE